MSRISILIAEDHLRYRKSIAALLNSDKRFKVIGETENGDNVVTLTTQLRPDIVLMDVKLEGKSGIDATRDIKQLNPSVKIIGISLYHDLLIKEQMLSSGASVYLTKDCTIDDIKFAIIQVKAGKRDDVVGKIL